MNNKVNINYKYIFLHVIVFILLMNMAGANILHSRYVLFTTGIVLICQAIANHNIKLNRGIFILIFIWISLNITAMAYFSVFYSFARLIINTVNLLILPYLLLKLYGSRVWFVFEKIIYLLTKLALFLYILNLIFLAFFNGLQDLFSSITTETLRINSNYWSAFVYVNAFTDNSYGILRNNGFMWEPGGMAMIIIWAVIFNQLNNNTNKTKFIIYFTTLLTTFSTAGYFAIALVILSRRVKKLTLVNLLIILILSFTFFLSYKQLDFLSGKVETYTEEFYKDRFGKKGNINKKVNRFQGAVTSINRTLEYPIGYGLISAEDLDKDDYSYGVNGLGSLMEMWGIPMFFFIIIQIYKYLKDINVSSNKLTLWFLFIALMILFFSNPIPRFLLVYIIVLTPISRIYRNKNYEFCRYEK